jgi:hypothetical protein
MLSGDAGPMSAYLSNIVARTITTRPGVQPRLGALFGAAPRGPEWTPKEYASTDLDDSRRVEPAILNSPPELINTPAISEPEIKPPDALSQREQPIVRKPRESAFEQTQPETIATHRVLPSLRPAEEISHLASRDEPDDKTQPKPRLEVLGPALTGHSNEMPGPETRKISAVPRSPLNEEGVLLPIAKPPSDSESKEDRTNPAPSLRPAVRDERPHHPVRNRADEATMTSSRDSSALLVVSENTRQVLIDKFAAQPAVAGRSATSTTEKEGVAPRSSRPMRDGSIPSQSSRIAPESPQTIEVTIGRIEIRATTSPQLAKRSVPAPRVMSLDEYLRRRSGGSGQ